ncbi:L-Aspartase-like protein [Aspergillus saccharolyticus JOP 1030-1]|uniref:L-Aspartase-like protein n=1 Tax=Aspergillus saccharolyticus JOP 1030-1 TaxID=1450539 RepID=A0A318ZD10_9EURO|nr:L-Aspartase-like protein [Aspergillus saccharolyticus JOP 1030-1]PYH41410.1 L-Aspartase-like protein [Aspergillus saccharolyticus JOP 1030-1]
MASDQETWGGSAESWGTFAHWPCRDGFPDIGITAIGARISSASSARSLFVYLSPIYPFFQCNLFKHIRTLPGTEEIRKVIDKDAYILERCLDAEAALARAQPRCEVNLPKMGGQFTWKLRDWDSISYLAACSSIVDDIYTPMVGRTRLLYARLLAFGYKCAVRLAGLQRHLKCLTQLRSDCLLAQFGGAAESLASMGSGNHGLRVYQVLVEGMRHKDPVYYRAYLITRSSTELGEVSELFVPHRGASSTMPQKRNPIPSDVIRAEFKSLLLNQMMANLDSIEELIVAKAVIMGLALLYAEAGGDLDFGKGTVSQLRGPINHFGTSMRLVEDMLAVDSNNRVRGEV